MADAAEMAGYYIRYQRTSDQLGFRAFSRVSKEG